MIKCKVCHKTKKDDEFWTKHSRTDDLIILETTCRDCISETLNYTNSFSLLLICHKLNIPYFYDIWQILKNKYGTTQNRKIVSKYVATMHLPAYRNMRFEDSEIFKK